MKQGITTKQKNTVERENITKRDASSRASRWVRDVIAAGFLGAMGPSGCGMLCPEDYPTGTAKLPKVTSNLARISKVTFRHNWSLTADYGTVYCKSNSAGDPILYFTASNGAEYALNSAIGNGGRSNIENIADGSMGPIHPLAFSVCGVK